MTYAAPTVERNDLYELLLRLTGRVPDDGLAIMRTCLADGEDDQVAELLVTAVTTRGLALVQHEVDVIRTLAAQHGVRTAELEKTALLDELPPPAFEFATPAIDQDGMDQQDAIVVEAASRVGGLLGLWRAVRRSKGSEVRLYLGEAEPDSDVVELAAEAQHSLVESGVEPRIELFTEGTELAPYHEAALEKAELVWTAAPPPRIHLARTFDGADPARGPYFKPDHPRLPHADVARALSFLRAGETVLSSTARMDDVMQPGQAAPVPVSFRSDGTWIWSDSVIYYLERYQLSPEPDLVDHALTSTPPPSVLSQLTYHHVLAELFAPAPQESMWQAS
ncbi:hypothetical protein [Saccharopolyspora spinosa]|uniref:Uncharacterized protein n=1 Tax=Saccharopolyspora spinosa TaxID=60894 RepID=A0A2N3Y568_SACSN|nr:hypothetical protein [Saccharopolyspora spinosa]PKW18023.1 hypothetical protein A8926_6076 [Saccharopolyspora spinosa]